MYHHISTRLYSYITMFRGSVKSTGYPLHSPVSPSLPLPASPCVFTFQLDSTAGYTMFRGSVKGTGYPLYSPVSPSLHPPASTCAITFQLDSKPTYTMLQRSVKGSLPTPFASIPFNSPPCLTVCHHISTVLYSELWMFACFLAIVIRNANRMYSALCYIAICDLSGSPMGS